MGFFVRLIREVAVLLLMNFELFVELFSISPDDDSSSETLSEIKVAECFVELPSFEIAKIFSFVHSDENFWNSAQLFIFHLKYKYSDDLNNGLVQDTNGTNISDLQMVLNWDHNANNGLVICVLDGVSFMEILATIPSPFLVPPARATSTQFTGALSRKIGPGQNQIHKLFLCYTILHILGTQLLEERYKLGYVLTALAM